MKTIAYIVSAMYYPSGMAKILTEKINWLAENTDFELYMIETERADLSHHYKVHERVKCVNFDINFDNIYTLPTWKRLFYQLSKKKEFRNKLSDFLMTIKPDITVSTLRREIDFINNIPDGSIKIGEIHFGKAYYRVFHKKEFPNWLNHLITKKWQNSLYKNIKKLKKFVVLTYEDKEQWGNLRNLEVIHNFVASQPNNKYSSNIKKVVALGRYTEQKGFDMLIKSWAIVEKKHPDWELNIYGFGEREQYQKQANDLGIKNIHCNEAVSDIDTVYRNASIYALSSRHEGMPLVLVEAMSYGLPCVAFSCPCGPKDIITNDTDGMLVEPNNIEEFAEKLNCLIENEDIRSEMSRKAILKSRQFQPDEIMKKWVILFNSL